MNINKENIKKLIEEAIEEKDPIEMMTKLTILYIIFLRSYLSLIPEMDRLKFLEDSFVLIKNEILSNNQVVN